MQLNQSFFQSSSTTGGSGTSSFPAAATGLHNHHKPKKKYPLPERSPTTRPPRAPLPPAPSPPPTCRPSATTTCLYLSLSPLLRLPPHNSTHPTPSLSTRKPRKPRAHAPFEFEMLPRVAPSPAAAAAAAVGQLSGAGSAACSVRVLGVAPAAGSTACRAAAKGKEVLSGVMFQPFEELKGELSLVPQGQDKSLARHKFVDECEAAINEQINVEYNASYAYHSLFAYFDRDNVALKGFAKFFKESSDEEREHAEKLMEYQNKRGGRVRLQSIVTPLTEFDHPEKGDALYAMELALALEKLVNEKLHNLHSVATRCNDPQLTDFVESEFLQEQVEAIKKISKYVAQLRRVGRGHGVWHFDRMLLEEAA